VADLNIDTAVLREAGAQLRIVATEFVHANVRSDDVAEAVGHDRLAERIRDFAHNWDDKREQMVEGVGQLAEIASGVGEVFEQVETEFVKALEGGS